MDEQRLWAPWRGDYISGNDAQSPPDLPSPSEWLPQADQACFLCRAAAKFADQAAADRQLHVVSRGPNVVTLLNRHPYNNGHLLLAPLRHEGSLEDLSDCEHEQVMATLVDMTQKLTNSIGAEGFNIGLNLGSVAGAGVPGHLHWHIVPRWVGDSNFMPTLASTRVISQSLDALWELLTAIE